MPTDTKLCVRLSFYYLLLSLEVIPLACYHPYFMAPSFKVDKDTGEVVSTYVFAGHYTPEKINLIPDGIKIPCGKCLGCKLDYSRSWADRMVLELDSYKGDGLFVTLTYNNDFVPYAYDPSDPDTPVGYSLRKSDLQKFFKRLRKDFKHIRYYACGEYGKKPLDGGCPRPHYHAIIFGLSLDDFPDLIQKGKNELEMPYYISELFMRYWSRYNRKTGLYDSFGYVCLSPVSYKTCAYVSRYVGKKVGGVSFAPTFWSEDEFAVMSRDPGIGATYLAYTPDALDLTNYFVNDGSGSIKVTIPKYFVNKIKVQDPEKYDKLCEERRKFAFDKEFLKLQQTDLEYVDYLEAEEEKLFNKTQILFKERK